MKQLNWKVEPWSAGSRLSVGVALRRRHTPPEVMLTRNTPLSYSPGSHTSRVPPVLYFARREQLPWLVSEGLPQHFPSAHHYTTAPSTGTRRLLGRRSRLPPRCLAPPGPSPSFSGPTGKGWVNIHEFRKRKFGR